MLRSVLELVKIASETLWRGDLPTYEIGSRQVEGGGGASADLRRFFPGLYVGVDLEPGLGVDVLYPEILGKIHIAGRVLCMEVLEHAPEPEDLACTINNILTPDGWALFSTPFDFAVHSPPDYRRYTPLGLETLLGHYFPHVYVLPTEPRDKPITVAALAWYGGHEAEILAFKTEAEAWCKRHAHPLRPGAGERVLACAHDTAAWGRLAEPVRVMGSDGLEVSSRWIGMCAACAGDGLDAKMIAKTFIFAG